MSLRSTSPPHPSGGFSLFPNTSSRPRNASISRDSSRSATPHAQPPPSTSNSPPPRPATPPPTSHPSEGGDRSTSPPRMTRARLPALHTSLPVQQPRTAAEAPLRVDTGFSDAPTLVRSPSPDIQRQHQHQHQQYQQHPQNHHRHHHNNHHRQPQSAPSSTHPPNPQPERQDTQHAMQSMFPQYNPDLRLSQQPYFPTQASPRNIPREVINRTSIPPSTSAAAAANGQPGRQSPSGSPFFSPNPAGPSSSSAWRSRVAVTQRSTPPKAPKISSTETLKGLWKVANGWRAPSTEGRVYCLRMTQDSDAPVYALSGAGQPFYTLRLDPTSISAKVTLTRQDPHKSFRPGGSAPPMQEVLCTSLEEESRRHSPNDGLVAVLYPTAACRAALDRPEDGHIVALAERECARLVWDSDSASHFLVHQALAVPFCVTVERTPSWSRVEYTLEHPESPQHIARLTRDGTGAGWLEIDTRLAGMIDAYYVVDVAVAALLLVASADESFPRTETFGPPPPSTMTTFPPPPSQPAAAVLAGSRASSRLSSRLEEHRERRREREARKMEEFDVDAESQHSSLGKGWRVRTRDRAGAGAAKREDRLPIWARCMIGSVTVTLKFLLWCISLVFRGVARCAGYN